MNIKDTLKNMYLEIQCFTFKYFMCLEVILIYSMWNEFIFSRWQSFCLKTIYLKMYLCSIAVICCGSVPQSCPALCDPMTCSKPGLPVLHYLPKFAQTHLSWVNDAIQSSHPQSCPSPSVFNLSQHQGLFQSVNSSHQVVKVLELKLQHQSF